MASGHPCASAGAPSARGDALGLDGARGCQERRGHDRRAAAAARPARRWVRGSSYPRHTD
eukprot:6324780-Pyramimonas_sp.AAC.1